MNLITQKGIKPSLLQRKKHWLSTNEKNIPLFVFPILAVFLSLFLFLSNRPIENKPIKSIDTDDTYCKQKDVSERAKCLFNIDKIEKLELTSKEPLDLTYHKSNKGIEVSLDGNSLPTAKDIEPTNTMYTLEYPDSFEEAGEEKANMIKSKINDLVNNAREGKPLDELNLDFDSAVNFYLFDELFYNSGFGSSSVYLYRPEDSKIVLGPLWDFDQLALQDYPENFNRPITCDNNLYRYLLKYPEFRDKLKEKLTWFKDNLSELSLNIIEEMRNNEVLKTAVEKNENLYHTWENPMKNLSVWQNDKIWRLKNWDEHLDYIKRFMDGRVDWLLEHFDDLK